MSFQFNWEKAFEKARSGDRRMMNEHVSNLYSNVLYPYLKEKAHHIEDVKDISNRVIEIFWQRFYINAQELPKNVNGYVYRMAMNAFVQFKRRKNKKNSTEVILNNEDHEFIFNSINNSVEDSHMIKNDQEEKEEMLTLMLKVFDKLEEKCKKIIKLNIYEGIRMKEIADIMGFATANAATKKKIHCLQHIKKLMYSEISL